MSKEVFFSINDCNFSFGKKQLFKDLCITIHKDDRIALVGKNGVGKTTLLKILSGQTIVDSGEHWINPKISFGYLRQKEKRNEDETVYNFLKKFSKTSLESYNFEIDSICEKMKIDKDLIVRNLSGGIQRVAIKHECAPFGNAKARAVVWTFPDPIPLHREPLYTSRRDLVADYPTYADKVFWRLPTMYESIQKKDFSKDYPMILTSGRLVEYEGGGDETRSNPWLAELQQDMFVEINPRDANDLGIRDGTNVWLEGAEGAKVLVKAMVTNRVGTGVAFMPFHFGGHFQGKDLRSKYPKGADPIVLGESSNTAQTYGYDSVTQMQETKATLCKIMPA